EGKDAEVNEDRVQYWVDQGAELSEKAHALIARKAPGVIKSLRDRELARVKKRSEKRKAKKK
ncbi:MAG: 30S ribosomal protein S16, partial [Chlamydiia bacterium]|nr:30S ribosomal protein S16 [Chlamydiia bacterium]